MINIYLIKTNEKSKSNDAYVLRCLKDLGINDKIELGYEDSGKPFLKGSKLFISIADTKGFLAIAFSESQIGVDIEKKRIVKYRRIVKKYFSEQAKHIKNSSDFLKAWTVKEAYSKISGKGFQIGFETITNEVLNNAFYKTYELDDDLILSVVCEEKDNVSIDYLS